MPAILNHIGRRRSYRGILIAGVVLLVLATIWLNDSIGIDGFGPAPHPQGQFPGASKEKGDAEIYVESPSPSSQAAMQTSQLTPKPASPTTPFSTATSSQPPTQTVSSSKSQTPLPATVTVPPIPTKIWQILLPERPEHDGRPPKPTSSEEAQSWASLNPNHTYALLDQHNASAFVRSHFSHTDPDLVKLYSALPDVRMKSDLLRYLVLDIEGGVYSDLDTVALKPISDWVPPSMQNATKLVVGIEASSRDAARWANTTRPARFCQWMIAAAPGHPAFGKMVGHVQKSMAKLSESYRLPVVELNLTNDEIMNSTGSAAWTEVVLEVLQEYDEALKNTKDLALLTEPRLIGDILVLPPDALSLRSDHSSTTSHASRPDSALVEHLSPETRRT